MGTVLWPGGKMPPVTAGKDARRYKSVAVPERRPALPLLPARTTSFANSRLG